MAKITKKSKSQTDKIVFQQGLVVGITTFVFSLMLGLLGAQLISSGNNLLGMYLIVGNGLMLIASIPSFVVAHTLFTRIGISSVSHVAATTVFATFTIASLATSRLPLFNGWYSLPLRAASYAIAGGVAAVLFNKLFKKIGAYDSANLVVFVMIVLAFMSVSGILRFHF